jgi:thiol-disulfide isomerase/thioredoxin
MTRTLHGRVVGGLLIFGLFLFGCSEETSKSPDTSNTKDTASTPDTTTSPDTTAPPAGYPAGPYGIEEGDVIANLELMNPDGSALLLGQLYQDPSAKMLLVSTSAGWCTACIEEQPTLQAKYEQYKDKGLVVMVSLFETIDYEPASAELAAAWKLQYELDFLVVADLEFVFADYYNTDLTPMNMFVNLETMEILYIGTGWDESVANAILESQL